MQFQYISIALNLTYNKNKLCKTLYHRSRDMFNFDFLEKGLAIVLRMIFQEKCLLYYILLNDRIYLSACVYFLRYCIVMFLQLFVSQFVTSWILRLTLSSWSSCFSKWSKSQDKNLNILRTKRTKRALKVN